MLGSPFDLEREIARIASERGTAPRPVRDKRTRAYSDFDRRMHDFVRSVGDAPDRDGGGGARSAAAGPANGHGATARLLQIR